VIHSYAMAKWSVGHSRMAVESVTELLSSFEVGQINVTLAN
jgi:hypothetical protein